MTEHRTRVAAYVLCVRDGAVLLSLLNDRTGSPGSWTLPGGGMEFGETPVEAARREVEEETGYIVEVGPQLFIETKSYEVGEHGDHAWQSVRIVHTATVVGGELRHEVAGGTTDEARWISISELTNHPLVGLAQHAVSHVGLPIALDHIQVAMPKGREVEARAFYEGLLNLPEIPKPAVLAARGGAWFARGQVRIDVGVEDQFAPAKKAHPAIRFLHLDALADKLTGAGCAVRWDDDNPGVRRFYTDDPFGNRIECVEA